MKYRGKKKIKKEEGEKVGTKDGKNTFKLRIRSC